jgi:hypothetical protein
MQNSTGILANKMTSSALHQPPMHLHTEKETGKKE